MSYMDSFSTERISAERLRENHIEFIHQMHQDERVMAYLGGIRSREQTTEYMKLNLEHWQKHGYGIWVLRENARSGLIGRGGLRNILLDGRDEIEVAYGLLPEFWNRGLATEFVLEVVRIGLFEIGLPSLVCVTHPDNLASQAVLQKAGFEFEKEVIYKKGQHLLFRHDNS